MTGKAQKILKDLSQHPRAKDGAQYDYSKDTEEKSREIRAIDELVELGYIAKVASAIGFAVCAITPAGTTAAELI